MSRMFARLLALSLAVAMSAGQALAGSPEDDDIPAPLTEDELAPPVGGDDGIADDDAPYDAHQPPVPIPAPYEIDPPVPIPAPHEIDPPVPMPAQRRAEPPAASPTPWATIPESVKRKLASVAQRLRGWGVSCRTERNGKRHEIRCTLSEPEGIPTPKGAPALSTRDDACGSGEESRLFSLLNAERRRRGLPALKCSARAVAVARAHSQDMCARRFFGHFTPEGGNPGRRLSRAGIRHRTAGENIARGHNSAEGVHAGWLGSAAHRRTMLSAAYTHVGIGLVECDATGPYWTEVFFR